MTFSSRSDGVHIGCDAHGCDAAIILPKVNGVIPLQPLRDGRWVSTIHGDPPRVIWNCAADHVADTEQGESHE